MVVEYLNICDDLVPHTVVPIVGDGACLFRAISYLMYETQMMAREVREKIVKHVAVNWEEFAVMTHDSNGDNHSSAVDYCIDMLRRSTYGSVCELVAASQVFPWVFEVYRDGELYVRYGTEGNVVGRLRFSENLSFGHFDAYVQSEVSEVSLPRFGSFSLSVVRVMKEKRNEINGSKPISTRSRHMSRSVPFKSPEGFMNRLLHERNKQKTARNIKSPEGFMNRLLHERNKQKTARNMCKKSQQPIVLL